MVQLELLTINLDRRSWEQSEANAGDFLALVLPGMVGASLNDDVTPLERFGRAVVQLAVNFPLEDNAIVDAARTMHPAWETWPKVDDSQNGARGRIEILFYGVRLVGVEVFVVVEVVGVVLVDIGRVHGEAANALGWDFYGDCRLPCGFAVGGVSCNVPLDGG